MSGSGEIIGDIAQGALVARAVEPNHGEAADGHTHESACLNCCTVLVGSHCHACGQAAHVHKTLGAFFHDLLHGVFHFEGKIWRTLPMLALKPGKLTREYIDGRRASYVSPIALFLFSVFLMFAVVKNAHIDIGSRADVVVNGKHIKGLEANQAEVARLEKERAVLVAQGKQTAAIDGEIDGRKTAIKEIEALKNPTKALEKVKVSQGEAPSSKVFDTDIPAFRAIANKLSENPQLALYELQSNAYKFAWALIPISVPFVWLLLFWKRRFGIYDHTVFVTYSLSFMMLLGSVLTIVSVLGVPAMVSVFVLAAPLHIYKQVRHTYALGRLGALWRTAALLFIALCALILFAVLILAETGA